MAKAGTRYYHDDIEFWAENGLIYVEDHRDDSFQAISVRDALQRAAVLSVEARRIRTKGKVGAEDRKHLLDCVDNLINACRQARKQGDPGDPKVLEDLRKQRKKNVLLPGPGVAGGKQQILLGNGEVAGTGPKQGKLWMP
jgi:hypothetical protein